MKSCQEYLKHALQQKINASNQKADTLRDEKSKVYMQGYLQALYELDRMLKQYQILEDQADTRQVSLF